MHFEEPRDDAMAAPKGGPWYRQLNSYHWFVLVVAVLGWSFDTMDQQLFNLARRPAMTELLSRSDGSAELSEEEKAEREAQVGWLGTVTTSIFLVGWASGGLIFGVLGDRIGRAKTMTLTILLYSLFTGLSALSVGVWDFALYRFLTGLGVGGEFAVGVALVAETIPESARPFALGWVQAFSAIGNITAALITSGLGFVQGSQGTIFDLSPWRVMFLIGSLPALLAVVIRARLREPERWKAVAGAEQAEREEGLPAPKQQLGSIRELFGDPRWRRNTIVGMLLAFSGVVGLWGIGFFSFDLFRLAFRSILQEQGYAGQELEGALTKYTGYISFFQNFGAFLGVYSFARITHYLGRRLTFAIMFVAAMAATIFTFWYVGRIGGLWTAYGMVFVMGFCQIALFGGYAIYFPELFPTRLRSTGTSFCYNVGRLVAAIGPLALGLLTSRVYAGYRVDGPDWPMRYACVTMCAIFLVGLCALPFAPETRGQPLPE